MDLAFSTAATVGNVNRVLEVTWAYKIQIWGATWKYFLRDKQGGYLALPFRVGANLKCLHVRWISVDSDSEPLSVLCSRPSSNCNFRPLLRRQVHVNPKIYTKRVNMPRFWNSLLHIRTVVMEKINIGMRVWTRTFILRNSTFFRVLTSLRIVSELLIKFKNRFSV